MTDKPISDRIGELLYLSRRVEHHQDLADADRERQRSGWIEQEESARTVALFRSLEERIVLSSTPKTSAEAATVAIIAAFRLGASLDKTGREYFAPTDAGETLESWLPRVLEGIHGVLRYLEREAHNEAVTELANRLLPLGWHNGR